MYTHLNTYENGDKCVFVHIYRHIRTHLSPFSCVLFELCSIPIPMILFTFFFFRNLIDTCVTVSSDVIIKTKKLQEIRIGFEFVLGLFGIVLRRVYLYGAWPRTALILIEFRFIVPEFW